MQITGGIVRLKEMKPKTAAKENKRKFIFTCQVTDDYLQAARFKSGIAGKREVDDFACQKVNAGLDERQITEKLSGMLKGLGFNRHRLILCLPRLQATCRYIKVPSRAKGEIENIIRLQAPRYLPYPAAELISGYEIISTDRQGFSSISLAIAHKDTVERLVRIMKELKTDNFMVILSSYGISNLYEAAMPAADTARLCIDLDQGEADFLIIAQRKLLYSRALKLPAQADRSAILADEINKTRDAFIKETGIRAEEKIFIGGEAKLSKLLTQELRTKGCDTLEADFRQVIAKKEIIEKTAPFNTSFSALLGAGLKDADDSLNLLPQEIRESMLKVSRKKDLLRNAGLILLIILISGLAIFKNIVNKEVYLKDIKAQLSKISKEAKPLEEVQERIDFIEKRSKREFTILDLIYDLRNELPADLSLTAFNYEDSKQIVLRGRSSDMAAVFELVSRLERSPVYKNFNCKVRYATKRKAVLAEYVDFEIICTKK